MALFRGISGPIQSTKDQYMRTNTKLQAGTHDSPGEKYLIDPRLKRLFRYHFGGDGWVVIPKGRVVAPATDNFGESQDGVMFDFDGNVKRPVLTLANGGVDVTEIGKDGTQHVRKANKAIGVAYANLYEEFVDGFNGMQPTIENEIYIELPYIPRKQDAEEMEWGSFYDVDPSRPVKPGDYVMSDENGRCIVADFDKVRADIDAAKAAAQAATTLDELKAALAQLADAEKEYTRLSEQVIGQVWAVETNLPPQGWLKWVMWSQEDMYQDDRWINNSGFRPEDIGAQDGFPGYPYEKTYMNIDQISGKYRPKGIPGLTNGWNIEVPYENQVIGYVQPGQKGRHDFRILHTPLVDGTVHIFANGTEITPQYVDSQTGLVVINYDNSAGTSPVEITASYKATGQIPGVPTGWDWKGSVGAVRILLQK
jgi:hypothetical protein